MAARVAAIAASMPVSAVRRPDDVRKLYREAAQQQAARTSAKPSVRSDAIGVGMKTARFTGIKRGDNGTIEIPVFKMYGPDGKPRIYYSGSKPERAELPARDENAGARDTAAVIYGPAAAGRSHGAAPAADAPAGKADGVEGASPKANAENKRGECQSCASRRYQDGSDDSGVSFQTPTHIGPEASAAAVAGHENEHRVREAQDARENGGRIVSSNIRIHMAQCPECKKMYAAGGVTETVKASKKDDELKIEGVGMFLDEAV